MSFKYRFILSFVLLEIFFILLIVSINFIAISNSSKTLIEGKINSDIAFIEELTKIPLSIYDLATLDNLLSKAKEQKLIDSIVILDNQGKILSKEYKFKYIPLKELLSLKENKQITKEKNNYEIRFKKIYEDDIFLGSLYIIFDTSESSVFIEKNKNNTILLVILEIIISTFLSFIIGNKLTQMLRKLSKVSESIAKREDITIPYQDKKDEIGDLARSMNLMSKQINESYINLQQLTIIQDKQKKDLEDANKSKDDFLANMSHELKTPLNSINVISSVMMKNKDEKLDEKQVKNLNVINQCGNDLLFLINDILDISKLEAGEMKLNYETFNLKDVIDDIQSMFSYQVEEKNINFNVEYNIKTKKIHSDKQRLKQIIKNLLGNSVKFVEEEKGKISLCINEDEENIKISVEDNGIGISKEKLEKIFDRFKQADGSTTRKFGGTGLGLTITKELCKLLKGDISVQSEENVKTAFKITLPKNLSLIEDFEVENDDNLASKEDKKNILLLNNDPILLMNFIIILKIKFEITQENSYEEFLKKIKLNNYFLILVDTNNLDENSLNQIIDSYGYKTILLSDKNPEEFKNKVKLVIKKPIDTKKSLEDILRIKENYEKQI